MSTATAGLSQREAARHRGNLVKAERAAFKRRLAAGEVDLADVLDPAAEIPDRLRSMPLRMALGAQRRWGPTKVRRFFTTTQIGEFRRLDDLTARQRAEIVARLRT